MANPRKYPSIPAARAGDPGSVVAALTAIKQTLDILTGVTGDGNNAALTSVSLPAALLPLVTDGTAGAAGDRGPPVYAVDGDDGMTIPGPIGPAGAAGERGPPGDTVDGDNGFSIPGPAGDTGATGERGPPGYSLDGDDGQTIPGPAGATGAAGERGPPGYALDGDDGMMWVPPMTGVAGPYYQAYAATGQVPSIGVFTKVNYDTDSGLAGATAIDTTNHRITPNQAGIYLVIASCYLKTSSSTTTPEYGLKLKKNGATDIQLNLFSGPLTFTEFVPQASALVYFNGSTDYIEAYGYIGDGTSPVLGGGQTNSVIQAFFVQ